jgi:hypothetical protein
MMRNKATRIATAAAAPATMIAIVWKVRRPTIGTTSEFRHYSQYQEVPGHMFELAWSACIDLGANEFRVVVAHDEGSEEILKKQKRSLQKGELNAVVFKEL